MAIRPNFPDPRFWIETQLSDNPPYRESSEMRRGTVTISAPILPSELITPRRCPQGPNPLSGENYPGGEFLPPGRRRAFISVVFGALAMPCRHNTIWLLKCYSTRHGLKDPTRSFDLPGSENIPERLENSMASKKRAKKSARSKSRLKKVGLKPVKSLAVMKWIE